MGEFSCSITNASRNLRFSFHRIFNAAFCSARMLDDEFISADVTINPPNYRWGDTFAIIANCK